MVHVKKGRSSQRRPGQDKSVSSRTYCKEPLFQVRKEFANLKRMKLEVVLPRKEGGVDKGAEDHGVEAHLTCDTNT